MRKRLGYLLLVLLVTASNARSQKQDDLWIRFEATGADGRDRVSFRLSPSVIYFGVVDHSDSQHGRSWFGRLDQKAGEFTIIEHGGRLYARIHLRDRTYELLPDRSTDRLVVKQFDAGKLPLHCGVGRPAKVASFMAMAAADPCEDADVAMFGEEATSDSACLGNPQHTPVWIEVLVAYTQAVEDEYGRAGVIVTANLSIKETNYAFVNSKVPARVRIGNWFFWRRWVPYWSPCVRKVAYNETGNLRTDLAALQYHGDTLLDEVRAIRDRCRADIAILAVNKSTDGTNGMACVMSDLSPDYSDYALGVVYAPSASAHYTFTHELAHMMGGGHEGNPGVITGMCDDSKGWGTLAPARSTIMFSNSLNRTLYFSGPDIPYAGTTTFTGTASANNARTLRVSAKTVSTFR